MEIPLNAQVECTDGICGRTESVLVNPVTDKVTHLVVQEDKSPNVVWHSASGFAGKPSDRARGSARPSEYSNGNRPPGQGQFKRSLKL